MHVMYSMFCFIFQCVYYINIDRGNPIFGNGHLSPIRLRSKMLIDMNKVVITQKTILHVFLENTEAAGYLRFAGKQSELSTVYICGAACIR